MTRTLSILLVIIQISNNFQFYLEAILHTFQEIVIVIWFMFLGEVIIVSLLSDYFFYQQNSHKYPKSATPRKDTELTKTW